MSPRPPSSLSCSMKAVITARYERCIGCWRPAIKPVSVLAREFIPVYTKLAMRPNEIWSWDITKIKSPAKWSIFHLFAVLDIFSCYVVGWMSAARETAELAEQFIAETVEKHNIEPGTLTLHADRGTSIRSKPAAALFVDLDVAKTHSWPHVSGDNPYSESQSRALKYRPDFPERFGSIEEARAHRAARCHARRRVCCQPNPVQGSRPETTQTTPTAVWISPPKKDSTPTPSAPTCSLNS